MPRPLRLSIDEQIELRKNIEGLSIRGRMAFAVSCLLNGVQKEGLTNPELGTAFELLLEFTRTEDFYDWDTMVSSRLGYILDLVEDLEENRVPELPHAKSMYSNVPIGVLKMVSDAIEIGLSELYGGIAHGSPATIELTCRIHEKSRARGWSTPDIQDFSRFTVKQEGGWGAPILKDEVGPVQAIWSGIKQLQESQ